MGVGNAQNQPGESEPRNSDQQSSSRENTPEKPGSEPQGAQPEPQPGEQQPQPSQGEPDDPRAADDPRQRVSARGRPMFAPPGADEVAPRPPASSMARNNTALRTLPKPGFPRRKYTLHATRETDLLATQ